MADIPGTENSEQAFYIAREVTFTATVKISDYGLTKEQASARIQSILAEGLNNGKGDYYDMWGELEFFEFVRDKELSRVED